MDALYPLPSKDTYILRLLGPKTLLCKGYALESWVLGFGMAGMVWSKG